MSNQITNNNNNANKQKSVFFIDDDKSDKTSSNFSLYSPSDSKTKNQQIINKSPPLPNEEMGFANQISNLLVPKKT